VGGCAVVSDKAQRTRKRALSWARYRQRDKSLHNRCWIPAVRLVSVEIKVYYGSVTLMARREKGIYDHGPAIVSFDSWRRACISRKLCFPCASCVLC
jgi:hypothetical protein